jgi:hypothetical protein
VPEQPRFTREELALAAENAIYEYSWTYEGERETLLGGDHALVHLLDVPWFGNDGFAGGLRFGEGKAEQQLDAVLTEVGDAERHFVWITGPSTRPANVGELLAARGLAPVIFWEGLALEDISWPYPDPSDVVVEQLRSDNVGAYIALCLRDNTDEAVRAERLAAANRLIGQGQREAQVFVAYVAGQPAGCSVLRVESNGIAYLRNAFTSSEFRNRGVYIAMVGARLAYAREAGCTAAVVQAQRQSSSPILKKRGFIKLCELVGHERGGAALAMG